MFEVMRLRSSDALADGGNALKEFTDKVNACEEEATRMGFMVQASVAFTLTGDMFVTLSFMKMDVTTRSVRPAYASEVERARKNERLGRTAG